jgi:capsular exopolysaccharide synthesis family protein
MSRIHEALKKAEQERAMLQPGAESAVTPPSLPEPSLPDDVLVAPGLPAATAVATAQAPASVIDGFRQTRWSPDPKAMLFFGNDEHVSGAEEFRTLRTRLYQAREKVQLSKLLVTSPLPKEGKSFTAANLAQVIVRQHGKRALLIDADLRNPQLHTLLGAEPGPGVAEFLRSEIDERSIIQRGPMENLCLIPAGRTSGNPAELVANGRIRLLTERLEPLFDWIIIDSAPAALVSDAGLLANYCDGVLLVVRSNATPVDAARRAAQEFPPEKLLGVVLNGIAPELSPYSQYYYSAYGQNGNKDGRN